jgi:hypothetical protein
MATNNSGTSTNNDGKGSTYAGTQTPDPQAPDGYQAPPPGKDAENTDQQASDKLGAEYDNKSSYGNREEDPASSAGEKSESDGDNAAGSPVRH